MYAWVHGHVDVDGDVVVVVVWVFSLLDLKSYCDVPRHNRRCYYYDDDVEMWILNELLNHRDHRYHCTHHTKWTEDADALIDAVLDVQSVR